MILRWGLGINIYKKQNSAICDTDERITVWH